MSVDPGFESRPEPSPHSLDFKFAEKGAETAHSGARAYSPGPSPCPSPALAETRPLARDGPFVHPLRPHLDIHTSASDPGGSSSLDLLRLAREDYAAASPLNYLEGRLERNASRMTVTSGDVQSVEAL